MIRSAFGFARSAATALAFVAGPAAAASAAGAGDNVLVVAPISVTAPSKLPGPCRVQARVLQTWAGAAFQVGQSIAIEVPCNDRAPVFDSRPLWRTPPAGEPLALGLDPVVLRRSVRGYVHLDDAGRLIWVPSNRGYGSYGVAVGYRVVDAVKLPADRPEAI
jgi:hypothetical protein